MKELYLLNLRETKKTFKRNPESSNTDEILCVYLNKPTHEDVFKNPLVRLSDPLSIRCDLYTCEKIYQLMKDNYVTHIHDLLQVNYDGLSDTIDFSIDREISHGYSFRKISIEEDVYNKLAETKPFVPIKVCLKSATESKDNNVCHYETILDVVDKRKSSPCERSILVFNN